MVGLAYDYTEGPASEWFRDFLERNSSPSWKDMDLGINGHFGSHTSMTEGARALLGMKQKQEKSIAVLVSQVSALVKVAYTDLTKRGESVV